MRTNLGRLRRIKEDKPMSSYKKRRPRGRPVKHPMPEKIHDTPENVLKSILATPPKKREDWDYVKESGRK